jgi:hypothetical protein
MIVCPLTGRQTPMTLLHAGGWRCAPGLAFQLEPPVYDVLHPTLLS